MYQYVIQNCRKSYNQIFVNIPKVFIYINVCYDNKSCYYIAIPFLWLFMWLYYMARPYFALLGVTPSRAK